MTVRIIGAPTDYGANRRGVDMGPSAIRYAGLAETVEPILPCQDDGDVPVPLAEKRNPEALEIEGNAKFLREVREVARTLSDRVAQTLREGETPLTLGGDHSISIGTLNGSARDADLGVLWFDAHGDFNTPETTPSGNVHGMPLAAALGVGPFDGVDWADAGIDPEKVALIGLRSVDNAERETIRESAINAFTMSDIDEHGAVDVMETALAAATDGTDGIHVSLDLDWLDPTEAPGVGTAVRGGVTYREAHAAMEEVAETEMLRSMDVVEVNPILDEHNATAELACELVASAMGKRVL